MHEITQTASHLSARQKPQQMQGNHRGQHITYKGRQSTHNHKAQPSVTHNQHHILAQKLMYFAKLKN